MHTFTRALTIVALSLGVIMTGSSALVAYAASQRPVLTKAIQIAPVQMRPLILRTFDQSPSSDAVSASRN